ncbi:YggS family pyridoxal phosphate-dependent enzyme [Silvimonas iriomotensis]|uniref:YggS family pyridoxal phosphate-dependent enzyme n=1 Tax=Silvimonas iriomotensis TaxID=449662 RepID=UPI0016651573
MTDHAPQALAAIHQRIDAAARQCARAPGSVTLLAVSKTFPAEDIRLFHAAGQRAFGENYVQEFAGKVDALADLADLEWHFIGPLQRNKTRVVAEHAHWVHAIDRLLIAERLSLQRPNEMPALNVCIQINVSGEDSKSGITAAQAPALAQAIAALPGIKLRGLMCIPEPTQDQAELGRQFTQMQDLLNTLNAQGLALDTLSMGMSADLEQAVAHGATLVRIGTALFGARPAKSTA